MSPFFGPRLSVNLYTERFYVRARLLSAIPTRKEKRPLCRPIFLLFSLLILLVNSTIPYQSLSAMSPVYQNLSNLKPLAKSYSCKFLFIAFLGIHILLIGLIIFVLLNPDGLTEFTVLGLTLVIILGAIAATEYILVRKISNLQQGELKDFCGGPGKGSVFTIVLN